MQADVQRPGPAGGEAGRGGDEARPGGRALAWHGALMTMLGLLSGFTPPLAAFPRGALAAHLIGVVQGALLFGLAGAWHLLRASPRVLAVVKYTALVGLYANWVGAQLAAFSGAGRAMFTVTGGAMPEGVSPALDAAVVVLLGTSALVLVACALILWSCRREAG